MKYFLLFIIRRIRQFCRHAIGTDLLILREIKPDVEMHGSDYGEWALLKQSLAADSNVLCFGVGMDASFDLSLINSYGLIVHAYDPTPRSASWVNANISEPKFIFHKAGISDQDGMIGFCVPTREESVSGSILPTANSQEIQVSVLSFSSIISDLGFDGVDYMKMDIEGAEYCVIESLFKLDRSKLPKQLAVEFHHFVEGCSRQQTMNSIKQLRELGYKIAWSSGMTYEVLFVLV